MVFNCNGTLMFYLSGLKHGFNISKCTIMRFTRSTSPLTFNYQLNNITLSSVNQNLYLGVLLDRKLSWSPHISRTASKAIRTLNFLKQNLSNCSTDAKAVAYLSMVRPLMEYAPAVWDPYYVGDTLELEKVQCRAARWGLNDYGRYSSVSSMLVQLGWVTLKIRCTTTRLQTLFKILHNAYSINIPPHYFPKTRHTRQYHTLHFIIPNSATAAYQQSYYSRTIKEWNHLPQEIIERGNLNLFTDKLLHYYILNHCS